MLHSAAFVVFLSANSALPPSSQSVGDSHLDVVRMMELAATSVTFGEPKLFQVLYDPSLYPTYSVTTVAIPHVTGKSKSKAVWSMTIKVDPQKDEVRFSGSRPKAPSTGEEIKMGRAVGLATDKLSQSGRLSFPFILSTASVKSARLVTFTRVPMVTGGFNIVEVSNDFRSIRIFPGH